MHIVPRKHLHDFSSNFEASTLGPYTVHTTQGLYTKLAQENIDTYKCIKPMCML